jgi:hypothetical protein
MDQIYVLYQCSATISSGVEQCEVAFLDSGKNGLPSRAFLIAITISSHDWLACIPNAHPVPGKHTEPLAMARLFVAVHKSAPRAG